MAVHSVGGLVFRSDFDSGNLDSVSLADDGTFLLSVAPDGKGVGSSVNFTHSPARLCRLIRKKSITLVLCRPPRRRASSRWRTRNARTCASCSCSPRSP